MSDLISRQVLLNELEHDLSCFETENKSEKEMYISVSDMRRMINGQPTAYDVDKVVKQVEKYKLKMSTVKLPHRFFNGIGINKVISIIKAGGVNE